jgi:hypothetical protein
MCANCEAYKIFRMRIFHCNVAAVFTLLPLQMVAGCHETARQPAGTTSPVAVTANPQTDSHSGSGWWFKNDHSPPIVDSAQDIERLPALTTWVSARGLSDADIPALARLGHLRDIGFTSGWKDEKAKIKDAGLAVIAQLPLPDLDILDIGFCENITDAGLIHLAEMQTVTQLLLLGNPQITDAGLREVVKMKKLVYLDLRKCTGITDSGLQVLAGKSDLQEILIGECTGITTDGVARLKAALPNATILKDDNDLALK